MKTIKQIAKIILYPVIAILRLIKGNLYGPRLNIIKTIYVNFRVFTWNLITFFLAYVVYF